jgi:arsenate reductase-like glutaredoxin family protein
MGARVTSMINSLQEEHRILRRPFILAGKDYLLQVTEEMKAMD